MPERRTTADDVLTLVDLFASVGVGIWIDGGWAVDAALERETRPHSDVDIVIEERHLDAAVAVLTAAGYRPVERDDTRAWNFVLGDAHGHEVDFHVVRLDEQGNGIYGPAENDEHWPAAALRTFGMVGGRRVASTSPEWLVASHTGYPLQDKDRADVRALCATFAIPLPAEYRHERSRSM